MRRSIYRRRFDRIVNMPKSWNDLSEEQLTGLPSRLAMDTLWAWISYHEFERLSSKYKPLKPAVKRDALRFGTLLCRGIAASQAADAKTDFNRTDCEFMYAAKCIRTGMRGADIAEVQALYDDLKGNLSPDQKFWFLHTFVAMAYEGKGEAKPKALDFFISQSTVIEFDSGASRNFPCESTFYMLWRGLLGDEPGPKLTRTQRQMLKAKVASFEGTKVAKTYERNRKRHLCK